MSTYSQAEIQIIRGKGEFGIWAVSRSLSSQALYLS